MLINYGNPQHNAENEHNKGKKKEKEEKKGLKSPKITEGEDYLEKRWVGMQEGRR